MMREPSGLVLSYFPSRGIKAPKAPNTTLQQTMVSKIIRSLRRVDTELNPSQMTHLQNISFVELSIEILALIMFGVSFIRGFGSVRLLT
jgi:hypothetical protein